MSILINGMELPTCGATMLLIFPNGDVRGMKYGSDKWELLGQANNLPPHGRLIDADALVRDNGIKEIPEYYEVVCDAPTIIPAEEGET